MSSAPSPCATEPVPQLSGLAAIAEDFELFLVDLWGVMHDGVRAFPAALDCVLRLREAGRKVVLVSNAPRRSAEVAERSQALGLLPKHYDLFVTSGEVTWRHLVSREDPFYAALGERGFHIGPERDRGLLEGLPYVFIESVEEADFLLCSGADGPEDRVEDYLTVLQAGLRRGLPMVCANPDLEVIRGGKREICAGAIAERYRALGGEVRQHGKPHRDIYEACFEAAGGFTRERTLAIGDSLRTDIAGAQALGIATLLVVDGIHAESLGLGGNGKIEEERLTALCRSEGACPQWIMKSLRW